MHYRALAAGDPNPAPLPPDSEREVLNTTQTLYLDQPYQVPVLAAHSIRINGQDVSLWSGTDASGALLAAWSEVAPGSFQSRVVNDAGQTILEITRRFVLAPNGYDITIEQRIANLTDQQLSVRWTQYGPGDLEIDRSRYIDRRRFRFGYLLPPADDPQRIWVRSDDNDLLIERSTIFKRSQVGGALEEATLWPNKVSLKREYELSWFGSTNRYFALAVHPLLPDPATSNKALTGVVDRIEAIASGADESTGRLFTNLYSPTIALAPGKTAILDLGTFAGPLDRHLLEEIEPYKSLAMSGLIVYTMSSTCAICTFQWLAHLLMNFLSVVHAVVGDWGVAIIVLVCVVRALLHPITKKSQINMMRFGKAMAAIKPEMDKLQKKFGSDPKKMQAEQLRLMREHGVNPLGCLSFVTIFLQMPIWIALYAMLYFAYDLRQAPAFWGVFQWISGGHWPFLADLSAADHFFWEFQQPHHFLLWNITGINLLPILMGALFYVQQKYMSPPPSANMTPEQMQTQKIMKVMFVVLMPLMLYSAPSGLTLYIFTSSLIGIWEGRYIRSHIDQLDLAKKNAGKEDNGAVTTESLFGKSKAKPKDPQARAFADAIERAKEKARARRNPGKTFKDRK
jgi:YidC/Oxa1 family membrane protein insertase